MEAIWLVLIWFEWTVNLTPLRPKIHVYLCLFMICGWQIKLRHYYVLIHVETVSFNWKTGYNTKWMQECITDNVMIYKKECLLLIKSVNIRKMRVVKLSPSAAKIFDSFGSHMGCSGLNFLLLWRHRVCRSRRLTTGILLSLLSSLKCIRSKLSRFWITHPAGKTLANFSMSK